MTIPVIFGCAGTGLTENEKVLFRSAKPAGLILFGRNCDNPDQVRTLVSDFAETIEDPCPMVLIDQEGGRVQRLKPPHWVQYPSMQAIGRLSLENGLSAAQACGHLIADDLRKLGINVNCAPVLDCSRSGASEVIGSRSFSNNPEKVSKLSKALATGLVDGSVVPVMKHIPGHGRAIKDSHKELPHIEASVETLSQTDFIPFKEHKSAPFAMCAHVSIDALDPGCPATLSQKVIQKIIREEIGFSGLLMTDDINMHALSGSMSERAKGALNAGIDLILHCSSIFEEMSEIVDTLDNISLNLSQHLEQIRKIWMNEPKPFDRQQALSILRSLELMPDEV